jgi:hypothetical protein
MKVLKRKSNRNSELKNPKPNLMQNLASCGIAHSIGIEK